MSKNRLKSKAADGPLIANREDAEMIINQIAIVTANKLRAISEMDAEKAKVGQKFEGNISACDRDLKAKIGALHAWAVANPGEFPKDRKSIEFMSGTIGFRTGQPKLALLNRKWNWKTVLDAVRDALPGFVRQIEELDKESIIAQRSSEHVKCALPQVGIKVVQDEDFYVEPKLTKTETRQVQQAA